MKAPLTILTLRRLPSLDGVRAIAVAVVMIVHANHVIVQGGPIGVDIFFCLSGFLIMSLLLEEWESQQSINLKNFYLRRGLRLLPALLVLLICSSIYAFFFMKAAPRNELLLTAVCSLCYVTNWGQAFGWLTAGGYGLGHTWSLSIEEQFYFLWPVALLCLLRHRARPWWVVIILVVAIAGVALERFLLWHAEPSFERIYRGLDTRADSLLAGAIAGMVATWGLLSVSRRAVRVTLGTTTIFSVLFLAASILAIKWPPAQRQVFLFRNGGSSVVALASSCILLWLRLYPSSLLDRILELRPLVWIGKISYGLYLWHWFIYAIVDDHPPRGGWKAIVSLKVGLSFGAALVSARYVEKPFLRLKDRFPSCRSVPPVSDPR